MASLSSFLCETEHFHVDKEKFIRDWLANTHQPANRKPRGRMGRDARNRKRVDRFSPPPFKKVKKATKQPEETQEPKNKFPGLKSIGLSGSTRKSSPVRKRTDLRFYNPHILFIEPEHKLELPDTVRNLIRRANWVYKSRIVPTELRVRLSFQLGIFPQLFSAIADLWGL
jgi:PD-(D/E)XK nuclease superfamily protein